MLATRAIIAPSRIAVVSTAGSTPASSSFGRLASRPNPRPKYRTPVMKSRTVPEDLRRAGRPYDPLANQQCRLHAPNANGNFCFDVTLSYRRLELPRRVPAGE